MRQLQSRVQRICLPARGQQVATAEATQRGEAERNLVICRSHEPTPVKTLRTISFSPKIILFFILVSLGCFSITAIGQDTVSFRNSGVKDIDRIHQGDTIEVDVVGSFEFDWRGGLNPEGFLDGIERLREPIFARCRTTTELAKLIADGYRQTLREPVVEVRILDRNGRTLSYIDGAVKNPLRLRIRREVRLNELVVLAGGFTDVIGNEISLFRPEGASCEGADSGSLPAETVSRVIKISDLLAGADGSNPKIVPGDIVTVVKSLPIYVIGGVGNPQRISARSGVTLTRAIDAAGGVAKNGSTESVTVYRRASGNAKVMTFDLDKVRAGQIADPALEANDIVEVRQKGEPPRRFAPIVDVRNTDARQMPLRVID